MVIRLGPRSRPIAEQQRFYRQSKEFEVDRECERFYAYNPKGYLKRIAEK